MDADKPSGMPIGNTISHANDCFSFALFKRQQAIRNHGQSLELAAGGARRYGVG